MMAQFTDMQTHITRCRFQFNIQTLHFIRSVGAKHKLLTLPAYKATCAGF